MQTALAGLRAPIRNSTKMEIIMKHTFAEWVANFLRPIIIAVLVSVTAFGGVSGPSLAQDTSDPIAVQLSIDGFRADRTTNSDFPTKGPEDRDEAFIEVFGQDLTTFGINHRLPDVHGTKDDYYGMRAGNVKSSGAPESWINQQGHVVQNPILWRGELAEGERAGFLVLVREQDNELAGTTAAILKLVFGACQVVAGPAAEVSKDPNVKAVAEGCKHAEDLTDNLPKNDKNELIGAFYVTVENADGRLQTTYLAANSELVDGDTAVTRIMGHGDDTFGITALEGAVTDDQVFFAMTDNESAGQYATVVSATTIERQDVYGYPKLNGKDVERGNCDNGKEVRLRLSDDTLVPMERGDVQIFSGDEIAGVNYFCRGSFEREGYLFDRRYDHFLVQRTRDKLNFYPFYIEPFASGDLFSARRFSARTTARVSGLVPNFDLPVGTNLIEHKLTQPAKALSYCEKVLSQSYAGWPIKPITSWWSAERADMFTTNQESWYGCEGERTHADLYGFTRLEGMIFAADKPQPVGTIPLYRYWKHDTLDNLTSTSLEFPLLSADVMNGYGPARLVGYIYPPSTAPRGDLKLLNTWYFPQTGDFLTSSKKAWQGKVGAKRKGGTLVRNEGFVMRGPK